MAPRDLYIDRLRSVMTAFVILHHTAITYGAIGGWFWHEIDPSSAPSSFLLTMFCATNQAYFMGFFFLLATVPVLALYIARTYKNVTSRPVFFLDPDRTQLS